MEGCLPSSLPCTQTTDAPTTGKGRDSPTCQSAPKHVELLLIIFFGGEKPRGATIQVLFLISCRFLDLGVGGRRRKGCDTPNTQEKEKGGEGGKRRGDSSSPPFPFLSLTAKGRRRNGKGGVPRRGKTNSKFFILSLPFPFSSPFGPFPLPVQ